MLVVLKQFVGGSSENLESITDEAGFCHHQKLEELYISTHAAKVSYCLCLFTSYIFLSLFSSCFKKIISAFSKRHCSLCRRLYCCQFQTSWNRLANAILFYCSIIWVTNDLCTILKCVVFIKKIHVGKTLSENSHKYGKENTCTSGDTLSRAALSFGKARSQMEKERLNLMKALGIHVCTYIISLSCSSKLHTSV